MGYNPIEDFQRKDLLESGDPDKIVRGTELQVEFDAISADLAKVRVEQGNLNYLPITGGTVNGDISARKITATEFVGGTLSATNVSGTTFAGNGAALTGMKMSQLTDVKMTNVARDDVLIWNGSAWEASDVYDIVSPLTYAGILDVTQPAPTANNGDVFVNDQEGEAHPSFKGIAGVLILEGKFVIYDAPTDEWNSPGNSADGGVNIVKAGSGIEVDSIKPSEPVVSIDRSETDTWYLASDAETSKWETVTGGIAYDNGNVGIGELDPSTRLDVSTNAGNGNAGQLVKITNTNTSSGTAKTLTIGTDNYFASNPGMTIVAESGLSFGVGDGSDLATQRDLVIDASGTTTVTGGFKAAQPGAGANATAIGDNAGLTSQSAGAIAVGAAAGQISQGSFGVAVGNAAGYTGQSEYGVAVGADAGKTNQNDFAVAVGNGAGSGTQSESAVAVGVLAGTSTQGVRAVAVGRGAGQVNQGDYSVALGFAAGGTNQGANGIIINSSGGAVNSTDAGHIVVRSSQGYLALNPSANTWTFDGGDVVATGNVTAYSDERLKDNVETLDGSKVYDMRGVSFTKDGEAGSGVIAQELQKVAPELVHEGEEYLSVAYGNLVGYLIEAVKDLKAEVEELKRVK